MSLLEYLVAKWGVETYNASLTNDIALLIAGKWYVAQVRDAADLDRKLHTFGLTPSGDIDDKFDTGRCGPRAIASNPMPITAYHARQVASRPAGLFAFKWNPEYKEDASLFNGRFEELPAE